MISFSCRKWEPLPELEPRTIPPPPPPVYAYGSKQVVKLDSFKLEPWGTTTSYVLSVYVGVNDSIIHLYESEYAKITVYENTLTYGFLPYPAKSFNKVVNSGEILKYRFVITDGTGIKSLSSPGYTITVP